MSQIISKYTYYLASIWRLVTGVRNWPLVTRIFLRLAPDKTPIIRLRDSNLQFKVRGPMDVWSVKETCLDRFYERCGTEVQAGWTVIDIGAGVGDFTLWAARKAKTVYAFEPFAESFGLLQDNVDLNEATNVHLFEEAVGGQRGTLTLDLSAGEPLQISVAMAENRPERDHVSVTCRTLEDIFQRLDIDHCHLLKIDCEGAEYAILFNTPDHILAKMDHIVLEYHEHVVQHTRSDLRDFLEHKGFQVDTWPNRVHAQLGYLYARH